MNPMTAGRGGARRGGLAEGAGPNECVCNVCSCAVCVLCAAYLNYTVPGTQPGGVNGPPGAALQPGTLTPPACVQIHVFISNKAASHSDGFCPDAVAQSLAACQEAAAPPTRRQTTPLLPSITAAAACSFYLFFTLVFFLLLLENKIPARLPEYRSEKQGRRQLFTFLSPSAHVAPTAVPGRRNERRGDDNRINTHFTGCCFK